MRRRKGLGIAPFCLPDMADISLSDKVTHGQMQEELQRLRAAITIVASRIGHDLGTIDARRVVELLAPPHERIAASPHAPKEPK